jgi:hypothetical protein
MQMKKKLFFLLPLLALVITFSSCEKCIECIYKDSYGNEREAYHCGKGNSAYETQFKHDFCDTAKKATSCGCSPYKP